MSTRLAGRVARRLWQTPMFALGLVALGIVAATAPLRVHPAHEFLRDLRTLRAALDGERELPDFETFVAPLAESSERFPRYQGEAAFLTGSYCFVRAEAEPDDANWRTLAIRSLMLAVQKGVDQSDVPALLYRLGMAQYRDNENQGDKLGEALTRVQQGLDLGYDDQARGYAFLAAAYLNLPQPNLTAALNANKKHLGFVSERDPETLGNCYYLHAVVLAKLQRPAEAIVELEKVGPRVSPKLSAQACFLEATCCEEEGRWSRAVELWSLLTPLAEHVPGGQARVLYSLALAHTRTDPPRIATAQALWRETVPLGGDEGQAATLRLGLSLLAGESSRPQETLDLWTKALADVRTGSEFQNRYLDRPRLYELLDAAGVILLERNEFARAHDLAAILARIAPAGEAEERVAHISYRWAGDLADRAATDDEKRETRARFQEAGDSYKRAAIAAARREKNSLNLLWQSGQCYLKSGDRVSAIAQFEQFVAGCQSAAPGDERRSSAHFSLAELLAAQGQPAQARAHLLKCIELNRPPHHYRALARLADDEIRDRKLEGARDILVQIITSAAGELPPDILESSLYQLGQVLLDLDEPDEAAARLGEAIRRFPDNPRALFVRDRLAEIAWQRARKIDIESIANAADRRPFVETQKQKRLALLTEALESYESLDREFRARTEARPLRLEESLLWRKAIFSIGNIKIDMGRHADAIGYFRHLQVSYAGRHESLIAAAQIYACWKVLIRLDDSASTSSVLTGPQLSPQPNPPATPQSPQQIAQQIAGDAVRSALDDLDKIPHERDDEVFHAGPTPFSREQWRQLIRRWAIELDTATRRITPRDFAPQN